MKRPKITAAARAGPMLVLLALALAASPPALADVACPPGSTTPGLFAAWYERALRLDAELVPPPPGGAPRPLPAELIELNLALLCNCGASDGACVEDETTLWLRGGRFEVRVAWETAGGLRGAGRWGRRSADAGSFWSLRGSDEELEVSVLDACAVNDRYWVFAAGVTDDHVEITVRDTFADQTLPYVKSRGRAFAPIEDTRAFATCP